MINLENIKIKSKPDFNRILKAFKRGEKSDRVPLFELFSNIEDQVAGAYVDRSGCKDEADYVMKRHIFYQTKLGYDYLNVRVKMGFPLPEGHSGKTSEGDRAYVQGGDSLIKNDEEFEKYVWPDFDKADWSPFEKVKPLLPEGMKILPLGPGGVLENVMWIVGYENLCYNMAENPKLVKKVFDEVGSRLVKLVELYMRIDTVGAMAIGDDMGFKTQTLLSPLDMREYCFPWHKKIVDVAHRYKKPIVLHSCGNLEKIYDDIIACGYDAKHSYEDVILPVWDFRKRCGAKISSFGGFDMNKICLLKGDEIRKHVRYIIDTCAKNGGYAFGTGNSVANYVPPENFLIAVEEAVNYGKY